MFHSNMSWTMVATACCLILVSYFAVVKGYPNSIFSGRPVSSFNGIDSPYTRQWSFDDISKKLSNHSRFKREFDDNVIMECTRMLSMEGDYYVKKGNHNDGDKDCAIFLFAEPDEKIEVYFNYFDMSCEYGGVINVFDGWELNGEVFPNEKDHLVPMRNRFKEFCGQKRMKQRFISSQNVALIQYRMPSDEVRGRFSFNVRFIRNPTPCNVFIQELNIVHTIKNYGTPSNCSVNTIFASAVSIQALNIGVVPTTGGRRELETGTVHKCEKRGLEDYVEIGGSAGFDSSRAFLADSICGLDSNPGKRTYKINCGTTSVRLSSSGIFDNSVTVYLKQLDMEDELNPNDFMDVDCSSSNIM